MDHLKIAVLAALQAVWIALRGTGRALLGRERFDGLIDMTGLRELKSRTWISKRHMGDGNTVFYRPHDQCIVDEVYGDGVYSGTEICPGQTVVDVGAHIGIFSLMAARKVGAGGKVISFEPSPRTLDLLRRNLSENSLPWIKLHAVALADVPGKAEFFVADDAVNNPAADSLVPSKDRKKVVVPLRRLDDILSEDGVADVDHLKIDVEGAEMRVLDGAPRTLARTRRIVMEVHQPIVDATAMRRRLESLGFTCRTISESSGGSVILEAVQRSSASR